MSDEQERRQRAVELLERHMYPNMADELREDNELDLPVEGVAGQCEDCGKDIEYGEWHIMEESDTDAIPDGVVSKKMCGEDNSIIICQDCSDRDDFPEDDD